MLRFKVVDDAPNMSPGDIAILFVSADENFKPGEDMGSYVPCVLTEEDFVNATPDLRIDYLMMRIRDTAQAFYDARVSGEDQELIRIDMTPWQLPELSERQGKQVVINVLEPRTSQEITITVDIDELQNAADPSGFVRKLFEDAESGLKEHYRTKEQA